MSDEGDSDDGLPLDVRDWDLPRIVVEDDRIIVFDEDWVGRSVAEGDDEDSVVDSILSEAWGKGLFGEGGEGDDEDIGELEESVGGLNNKKDGGDFYKPESNENFYEGGSYDAGVYDEGEDEVEYIKISEVEVVMEERRFSKSMLEVAGFVDEEAEKKRDSIRDLYRG